MKSFICVVLVTIFAANTFAATAIGIYKNPKHPGKCAINANLILSQGDIVKDPNMDCGRIICGRNGVAEFQSCGVESYPGCTLGDYVDKSLPYPDCCKRIVICKN